MDIDETEPHTSTTLTHLAMHLEDRKIGCGGAHFASVGNERRHAAGADDHTNADERAQHIDGDVRRRTTGDADADSGCRHRDVSAIHRAAPIEASTRDGAAEAESRLRRKRGGAHSIAIRKVRIIALLFLSVFHSVFSFSLSPSKLMIVFANNVTRDLMNTGF